MSIAQIFHWVQCTGWANALRESEFVYPIVLSLHLCAIAFFGGAILITNLRLLGLNLKDRPTSEVLRQLRPWKVAGFVLVIACGVLLASAKADTYYPDTYFRINSCCSVCWAFMAWCSGAAFTERTPSFNPAPPGLPAAYRWRYGWGFCRWAAGSPITKSRSRSSHL